MTETRRRGWHTVKVRKEGQSSLFNLPPTICLPLYSPWARVTRFPVRYDILTFPPLETCLKGKRPILFHLCHKCQVLVYILSKNTKRVCHRIWAHVSWSLEVSVSSDCIAQGCLWCHSSGNVFKTKICCLAEMHVLQRKSWLTGNKHTYFLLLFLKV